MRREKQEAAAERDAVPAEFTINDLDLPGAFQDLGRELEAGGIDLSGRDKILRILRPAAWKQHLVGGGATADREHLARLRRGRQETEARAADLEARGERQGAESLRGGLISIDQDISKHEALVAAAGDAPSHDQRARRARLDTAIARRSQAQAQLAPYLTARLPAPAGLEDAVLAAERAEIEASAAWDSGCREFEAAGAEVQKLSAKLYAAIVAEGETLCEGLGKQAEQLCMADLALYVRFPNRAPNELIGLHNRAERVSGLMDRLGSTARRGLAAFWKGTGDAEAVVMGKVKAGPATSESWKRPRQDPLGRANKVLDRELGGVVS